MSNDVQGQSSTERRDSIRELRRDRTRTRENYRVRKRTIENKEPAKPWNRVGVQFPWFGARVSEERGERAAGLVGGEQFAEVGQQRAVL